MGTRTKRGRNAKHTQSADALCHRDDPGQRLFIRHAFAVGSIWAWESLWRWERVCLLDTRSGFCANRRLANSTRGARRARQPRRPESVTQLGVHANFAKSVGHTVWSARDRMDVR